MTHALVTGPIRGSVTLADGTEIDVTPAVVMLDDPAQVAEAAQLIGDRYQEEGHPDHLGSEPFVHDSEASAEALAPLTEGL